MPVARLRCLPLQGEVGGGRGPWDLKPLLKPTLPYTP